MARIRTIKPEFFRHEALQDLEIDNPGKYPMMVFEGIWGHCDNKGRFEWKPRQLKLDILPFLPFDMADTLSILEGAKMVRRYTVDGKTYGEIPTFEKHQRISGKELTEGEKFPPNPDCNREATGKQQGSNGDEQESQEGKGREEEGNGVNRAPEKPARFNFRAELGNLGVQDPVLSDWLTLRKQKRAPVTETVIRGISDEASRAGITLHDALAICCRRGWQGFEAEWLKDNANGKNGSGRASGIAGTIAELTGANRQDARVVEGTATRVD